MRKVMMMTMVMVMMIMRREGTSLPWLPDVPRKEAFSRCAGERRKRKEGGRAVAIYRRSSCQVPAVPFVAWGGGQARSRAESELPNRLGSCEGRSLHGCLGVQASSGPRSSEGP